MKKEFIGIDVSKLTLDLWLYYGNLHKQVSNDEKGFKQMLLWVKQTGLDLSQVAFCMEHTGIYSLRLSTFLTEQGTCFYVVSGLLIKRSLGLQRGKSDKTDARSIARFTYLHRDELKPYVMPSSTLLEIKNLLSFRNRLVKQMSGYKAWLQESNYLKATDQDQATITISKEMVEVLSQKIKAIQTELTRLIRSDPQLLDRYNHITSIKGVGPILAATMLVYTNNFQAFSSWRKFACYAGIAPFKHQSGTSYKGRSRVSSLANRDIKTLLGLAAATAIQYSPEMKQYYERRLLQGKSKMATLNIIRNKLVSRMFAVATRQSPYIDIHKFAA